MWHGGRPWGRSLWSSESPADRHQTDRSPRRARRGLGRLAFRMRAQGGSPSPFLATSISAAHWVKLDLEIPTRPAKSSNGGSEGPG